MNDSTTQQAMSARPHFEAVFTGQEINDFEARLNEEWGAKRRLVMITLSRSSESLIDGFSPSIAEDGGAVIMELMDQISDYQSHLKAGVEMAEAALTRLLLVGGFLTTGQG